MQSERYTKAAPGLLTPAAYIERAKAALRTQYKDIQPTSYPDPFVTRRTYANAPAKDQHIICVQFSYSEMMKAPISLMKRLPNPEWPVRPALLVLMREDLSKIYVNEIYYQIW